MPRRIAPLVAILILGSVALAAAPDSSPATPKLPHIVVLATGGTIAGTAASATEGDYEAATLAVDTLLAAVPELADVAEVHGEQIANIASQDMTDEVWLRLARRINALLEEDSVDGVVVTHGTDTLEETAYLLHLVVHSDKPVVVTGAMRPATALSADGPLNLYSSVAVAAHPDAAGRGVLVVLNDDIHGAHAVTKTSTVDVQAFSSPEHGLMGIVHFGDVIFFRRPHSRHTTSSELALGEVDALPRVDIVYAYADMDGALIDAAVRAGAKGLVVAGTGNGNMSAAALAALGRAARKGVVCVRSSRVAGGIVGRNLEVDDDALGLVAADELNPQKARVLLQLALLEERSVAEVQELFLAY